MILNLTQHPASPEQIAAGVVDLPAEHAVHTTPSLEWVMEKMADKTTRQVTPFEEWFAAKNALRTASIEAVRGTPERRAADAALLAFERKYPKPRAAGWKDVGRDDPLLQLIFGDKK